MHTRGTDAIPLVPRPTLKQYQQQAAKLVEASRTGETAALRDWATAWIEGLARRQHLTATPHYVTGKSRRLNRKHINEEVNIILRDAEGTRTLTEARLCIARLHGFTTWPRFARHVEALRTPASRIAIFETAVDAIVTGKLAALSRLLRRNPWLSRARSSREHRATLLHYIAANGHEGYRQRSPKNAPAIARRLLEAGAKPDALADMYGHRCTTMQMLVSSVHPHNARVQVPLVETLIEFGADANGVNGDGSPLMTAFRFHYPAAAEALARRGARIDNVITAAALGRVDLVDRFVRAGGRLRPGVARASGPWPRLSKDPGQHLGYALTWACTFGRDEVVELLLRKGVDASGRDDDATALHFAAAHGRINLVHLLLEHGASLETLNSYGGTVLNGTIWYAFNAPIDGVDYPAVVRELIDAGARVDLYPRLKAHVNAVLKGQRGGGYPKVAAG